MNRYAFLLPTIVFAVIGAGPGAAVPASESPIDERTHGLPKKVTLATDTVRAPLDLDHGQPIVALKINGKGPFNFFVDSGAGGTVFNGDLAIELGLDSVGTVQIGDPIATDAIRAKVVQVDKLEIGGATFENFQAVAWDRQFLRGPASPRGVLGFPVYRELLATYDFPNKQLIFTRGELPPANGETVIEYSADHNIPEIDITVGGQTLKGHLDSGSAGFLMVPKDLETKMKLTGPVKEIGQARMAASTMKLRGGTLDGTFRFGGQDFPNPDIVFSELPIANAGSALLRAFAVTFDQKNQRIGFAYSPGAAAAALARSRPSPYGIRIAPSEKAEPVVMGVDPGSPSERGGVQAGDVIRTVNGVAFDQVPMEKRRELFRQSPLVLGVDRAGKRVELTLTLPAEAEGAAATKKAD